MQQQKFKLFDERPILSVSEVVEGVRSQLETRFRDLWVRGEISNLRAPPSGHLYFTLKDGQSQLKAVCFRLQRRLLKFRPQDGLEVLVRGSLTVYAPRGDFQMVAELMEPVGPGALQIAFEQLKARLQSEGLFDPERKKPLPRLPSKIGVITSPSGAAIQDILRVLGRRNNRVNVLIFPSKVQGEGAAHELVAGLHCLNRRRDIDVIILARGGGSLEDLWAFNEEALARAIQESRIPVISAVGHEIDFTIADFVADLRAPTPSAAAEIVSEARQELCNCVDGLVRRSLHALRLAIARRREQLQRLAASRAFVDAESRLRFYLQRLDELSSRLHRIMPGRLQPARQQIAQWRKLLVGQFQFYLQTRAQHQKALTAQLQAFSPVSILDRGYAIVTSEAGRIIHDPAQISRGDRFQVQVAKGRFQGKKL